MKWKSLRHESSLLYNYGAELITLLNWFKSLFSRYECGERQSLSREETEEVCRALFTNSRQSSSGRQVSVWEVMNAPGSGLL